MKRSILIMATMALAFASSHAQSVLYGDVAVIVNDNSTSSVTIGNYYAQQRGITPNRILHVSAPNATDIDSLQFEDMRAQIEAALITGNLLDSVNYLVTTKGMPARISIRNGCDSSAYASTMAFNRCTSTETELALIMGIHANEILQSVPSYNPYHLSTGYFNRNAYGIFLVSRLDGFTDGAAMSLIDHGGPERQIQFQDAEVVLDYSGFGLSSSTATYYGQQHQDIETSLSALGYTVLQDTIRATAITNQSNVVAYVTGQQGDSVTPFDPNISFSPGALVDIWSDFGLMGTNDPTAYTAGDAIDAGAGAVVSAVGLYWGGPGYQARLGTDLYLDTIPVRRYNVAEVFYRSTTILSQAQVLYGDPKTSITPSLIMSTPDPQRLDFAMFPNPSQGLFTVRLASGSASDCSLHISDLQGKALLATTHKGDAAIEVDARALPAGMYIVRVQQGAASFARKLSIVH